MKAAAFLDLELIYRSGLQAIAQRATIERLKEWIPDLKGISGYVELDLLEVFLAEQPKLELFAILTTGDAAIVVLSEVEKIRYAARFGSYKASWEIVTSKSPGDFVVGETGSYGDWQHCYACLYNLETRRHSLVMYDPPERRRGVGEGKRDQVLLRLFRLRVGEFFS